MAARHTKRRHKARRHVSAATRKRESAREKGRKHPHRGAHEKHRRSARKAVRHPRITRVAKHTSVRHGGFSRKRAKRGRIRPARFAHGHNRRHARFKKGRNRHLSRFKAGRRHFHAWS